LLDLLLVTTPANETLTKVGSGLADLLAALVVGAGDVKNTPITVLPRLDGAPAIRLSTALDIDPLDGVLVADENLVYGAVKLLPAPSVEATTTGGRTGFAGLNGSVGVFGAGNVKGLAVGFLAAADGVGGVGFVAVLHLPINALAAGPAIDVLLGTGVPAGSDGLSVLVVDVRVLVTGDLDGLGLGVDLDGLRFGLELFGGLGVVLLLFMLDPLLVPDVTKTANGGDTSEATQDLQGGVPSAVVLLRLLLLLLLLVAVSAVTTLLLLLLLLLTAVSALGVVLAVTALSAVTTGSSTVSVGVVDDGCGLVLGVDGDGFGLLLELLGGLGVVILALVLEPLVVANISETTDGSNTGKTTQNLDTVVIPLRRERVLDALESLLQTAVGLLVAVVLVRVVRHD